MHPSRPPSEFAFHGIKQDYPDRSIQKALEIGQITKQDADLIREYVADSQTSRNIGGKRAQKIVFVLVGLRRFIGPFTENSIADLYSGVSKIKTGTSLRGKQFASETISDYIGMLKTFYRWLNEEEYVSLPEKKLDKIQIPRRISWKTANDLLTVTEIAQMMDVCRTSRERAFLSTLYEGGFRIGEIGQMVWNDLKFDGTGVVINVNFKTGKDWYIRQVMAREHLIKWKSDYHGDPSGDNLVFMSELQIPPTRAALNKTLMVTTKRAGIEKHFTPHVLRHSRITHLIQQGVNESVIKLMMWGSIDSKMFSTYAHLTGSEIDREINRLYGISNDELEATANRMLPKVCPHCKEVNSPVSKHCHICGESLDNEISTDNDFLQDFLKRHIKEFKDFFDQMSDNPPHPVP
jgi:site-specific recombinase XerD